MAGLGAFGPGILRELGWLNDQDEFQRQAARRAGYHAWLFSALLTYWGARRTTTVVLLIFGSFWLVFGVATIISEATRAVHRWPRITGRVLVAVAHVAVRPVGNGRLVHAAPHPDTAPPASVRVRDRASKG